MSHSGSISMRNLLPNAAAQSRSLVVAVVLGTAFATGGGSKVNAATVEQAMKSQDLVPDQLQAITRYCNVCWRNARLPIDDWNDCTQQVLTRLLERLETSRWSRVLVNDDSEERKEFVRAIDTIKKRNQRTRRYGDLTIEQADHRQQFEASRHDLWEQVNTVAVEVLSPRQQRIVELSAGGWNVPEIADALGTTPERVSDEKYKAIRKLREHLTVDA
jgi:RNA polymerase sigma factor (sigma-70 family)